MFESRIWAALNRFDPAQPVIVESESKRIGVLHVPDELMSAMWESLCVRLECETIVRVELLCAQYGHFLSDPRALGARLDCLAQLHGRAVIDGWKQMAQAGSWEKLVSALLEQHYDPAYARSILKHYPGVSTAPLIRLRNASEASFEAAARALIALISSREAPTPAAVSF
jgi:tRNA 2-selenouridine synthase